MFRIVALLAVLCCAGAGWAQDAGKTDSGVRPPADDAAAAQPPGSVGDGQAGGDSGADAEASGDSSAPTPRRPLLILGEEVAPGTRRHLGWVPVRHFTGVFSPTPVLVTHGARPGPVLCLTAALHGDELNGIEIVRRVLYTVDPAELAGTLVGVPIVNLAGFQRQSRYLPDRRDLNRAFPGDPRGSLAARTAHSLFTQIIVHCDRLVDLHTGSFHRTNLVQLRGDLGRPEILQMTRAFGAIAVLHSRGIPGSLRRAATDAGIAAVTLEVGEPLRLQAEEVETGVRGIRSLMDALGMLPARHRWTRTQPVYYRSHWLRADQGGILFSLVRPGERVTGGQLLGTVTDPVTNERSEIRARRDGRVLGMAVNQVVMPGFAAYHIGIETSEQEAAGASALDGSGYEDVEATEDGPDPDPEAPGGGEEVGDGD